MKALALFVGEVGLFVGAIAVVGIVAGRVVNRLLHRHRPDDDKPFEPLPARRLPEQPRSQDSDGSL